MIHIVTYLYGTKWPIEYVDKLFNSIARNLSEPHRSILMTDRHWTPSADVCCQIDPEDHIYLERLGCLARMRLFDKEWQTGLDIDPGDIIINVDVDAVITDKLDPLVMGDDEFVIMQGYNSTNPCPYNGSLWKFRAGERHDVWNDFSPEAHAKFKVPIHSIADDQGWLFHKFPAAKAYTPADGVFAFHKKTWPVVNGRVDMALPKGARLVAFPGRDPGNFQHLDWVRDHWRV